MSNKSTNKSNTVVTNDDKEGGWKEDDNYGSGWD